MKRTPFIPEDKLVVRLQAHDPQAFSYLYDHYSAALNGVIIHMIRSRELAEDIVQDTFVKIWNRIHAYDPHKGSLFTWMLHIARNTTLDKVRSLDYRHHQKVSDVDTQMYVIDTQKHHQAEVDTIGLHTFIAQLRMEHQQVIEYLYFRGYTHSELAEELDIPLGTVKTRIKAAVQHLRKFLYTDVQTLAS